MDIFPYKHVNYELDYLIRYIFFKVFWYWMNVLNVMQLSFVLLVILTLILFTGHFTIEERPNWRLCQRSVRPRRKKCWHFWIFCKWDQGIEGQDCVSWYSGRRRTTEYCSELVTLRRRKQKKVWQQKKTGVVEKLQNLF